MFVDSLTSNFNTYFSQNSSRIIRDCSMFYTIKNALVKCNVESIICVLYSVIIQYLLRFQTADLIICTQTLLCMAGARYTVLYHWGTESILS